MYRYRPVKMLIRCPEAGICCTYGIRCYHKGRGRWRQAAFVGDVSPSRAFVAGLARQFSRLQLSPVHLRDAVEDVLDSP